MSGLHILVIGAAGIDTKGRAGKPIQVGTSTPGTIRVGVGGVARNIAENLVRLGERVVLLSAVGDDGSGRRILSQAAECGIDVRHVVVSSDYHTAAYLALLDEQGELLMSIDDMVIHRRLITPGLVYRHRILFRQARMIIVDANLAPAALRTIFTLAARYGVPICADPATGTLAPRLRPYISQLLLVAPNGVEAETLCGVAVHDRDSALVAAQALVGLGCRIAIVALGATGVVYATSQESGHVPAMAVDVVDLTGAGDALTAATVFGLLNDLPVGEAVRLGVAAAALTLQSRETVWPDLSLERIYDQLAI
jgi:pseudouridine kinase